jgi:hypothetical protein
VIAGAVGGGDQDGSDLMFAHKSKKPAVNKKNRISGFFVHGRLL